jgi:dihydroxycyclohexadiene carboxylate dehydrogenase
MTGAPCFPGRFAGKVVIVTGAGQGIGRDAALRFAREGARTVLCDRSPIVEETAAIAESETLTVLADLETSGGATELARRALETFGRIDVLVNNVGGTIRVKPFATYTTDEIEAEIRRSLFPTLWCCHAVLPTMLRQQHGSIVNLSSVATRGLNRAPYAAAKGGVNALTVGLAWEYAGHGIRVNAVAPGGTEAPVRHVPRNPAPPTPQEETWYREIVDQTLQSSFMRRYGTMAEQTAAILFLASDEASYITGTVMPVGGGDLG